MRGGWDGTHSHTDTPVFTITTLLGPKQRWETAGSQEREMREKNAPRPGSLLSLCVSLAAA